MAIIATNQGGDFEKAPTGMQQAVCVFVHDIGFQVGEWLGKELVRHQIIVTWELAEQMKSGERFMVSKYYTLSLAEKANLRKDLESWRGKAFTQQELAGLDIESLVGANCYLNINATANDKRKIVAVVPLPKTLQPIQRVAISPSENQNKWIERERAKAVHPTTPVAQAPDEKDDDLPF